MPIDKIVEMYGINKKSVYAISHKLSNDDDLNNINTSSSNNENNEIINEKPDTINEVISKELLAEHSNNDIEIKNDNITHDNNDLINYLNKNNVDIDNDNNVNNDNDNIIIEEKENTIKEKLPLLKLKISIGFNEEDNIINDNNKIHQQQFSYIVMILILFAAIKLICQIMKKIIILLKFVNIGYILNPI